MAIKITNFENWVIPDGFSPSTVVQPARIPMSARTDLAAYHPVDLGNSAYNCAIRQVNRTDNFVYVDLSESWNEQFSDIARNLRLLEVVGADGRAMLEDRTIGEYAKNTPFGQTRDWFITNWQVKKIYEPNDEDTVKAIEETVTWVTLANGGDKIETMYAWPRYKRTPIGGRRVVVEERSVPSDSQPQTVINIYVPK